MSDEHVCRRPTSCTCGVTALEPADDCPRHSGGEWPPRCETCGRFLPWPGGAIFTPGGTPDAPARAAAPLPDGYATFAAALYADIIAGFQARHQLPPAVIDVTAFPPFREVAEAWFTLQRLRRFELERARVAGPPPFYLNSPLANLTNQGNPVIVSESQAAHSPPGTIGENDMSTLHGLAQSAATTAATLTNGGFTVLEHPPARLLVGEYLLSLFAHAEDALAIRYGRQVDVLPRYMGTVRIPPGRYTVVKHHRVDGVAYVSVKAAKPKVPGGKLDPHVHTRVPVNDVNPVPFWNVFPAGVYGPTAPILCGLAANGFPAGEMYLLADHWVESGFTFKPNVTRANALPTATAEEFAAAWAEFFTSDAVKAVPPVKWAISFNVNRANHHPA